MTSKPTKLADEKLAVSLFLDSLLRETELEEPVIQTRAPVYEVKIEPEPVVEAEVKSTLVVESPPVEVPVITEPEAITETDKQQETPLPSWSEEPFQALLFNVAGLTLAVPLVELNGVVEWTDSLTEMPGHADLYMGILRHLDNKVAVVDTARLVFPSDKLKTLAGDEPKDRVKRIVLIGDSKWGLACDEVHEVITLQPDDVRWRTDRTSRFWLLGTVIDKMCALLDVPGFARMLAEGK